MKKKLSFLQLCLSFFTYFVLSFFMLTAFPLARNYPQKTKKPYIQVVVDGDRVDRQIVAIKKGASFKEIMAKIKSKEKVNTKDFLPNERYREDCSIFLPCAQHGESS